MNCVIAFIIGILFTLIVFIIGTITETKKSENKVHFYVARDKSGGLWLYLKKPIRADGFFYCSHGQILSSSDHFSKYGLNVLDYINLKWEDEPVEVFLNLED